jgi:putative hydroxymethylpyrimidine transport system ATP-binding protein
MPQDRPASPFSVFVRAARFSFGDKLLFDGLDLALAGGRWTCLLGPSGVGKSTLLRLILGLEGPLGEGGAVECSDGLPLAGRAAFMAQRDLLFPWLSVIDNLTLGSRLRGGRPARRDGEGRARGLLSRVGLAENAGDLPESLSGGMRQRTALARTLMEDRPVVLMDEPFSSLDAITRLRQQNLAVELLEGRTVLLVTHDPLEALRLGHRIHILSGRPARLDDALLPGGVPPRDVAQPGLLEMQGDLLKHLAAASA